MNIKDEQSTTVSNEKPRNRTLSLIGAISSAFSIIPWLLFWGAVIPYIIRCDYSSVDLDDLLIFTFCGIPLIILCVICGGLIGIGVGNAFFSRWLKPFQAKLGAMLGGFLAPFLSALGMMLFFYSPWNSGVTPIQWTSMPRCSPPSDVLTLWLSSMPALGSGLRPFWMRTVLTNSSLIVPTSRFSSSAERNRRLFARVAGWLAAFSIDIQFSQHTGSHSGFATFPIFFLEKPQNGNALAQKIVAFP